MRRLLLLFAVLLLPLKLWAESIEIGLLLTPKQRQAYEEVFQDFTQQSGIEVVLNPRNDAAYKAQLPLWLAPGAEGPDVLYWQASQHLFALVEPYQLLPLDLLWQEQQLDQYFAHLKPSVSYQGKVYAVPYSYYHWGLYYKKSQLARFGEPPSTWQEFIDICQQMKAAGLTPLGLGAEEYWPAAAWFDYLNLRINGLAFHQSVLAGQVPFTDPRVRKVFEHWRQLVELELFNQDSHSSAWHEVAAQVYREQIGFTLIGNFALSKWPKSKRAELGFMPFPQITEQAPYEVAPTEVFMLNPNTQKRELAEEFLRFIARADTQSLLNSRLGYLPPNKRAVVGNDYFVQQGFSLLNQAEGVSQYFDRDTLPEFEKRAVRIFAQFVRNGDVEATLLLLEHARRSSLVAHSN